MAKLSFFFILISIPLIVSHQSCWKPPLALFIFGDSIFDAGNNNYINTITLDQANFLPYGESYFHYPTGRFSDGRLISDFIAHHANLPMIPPYLQPRNYHGNMKNYHGVNFASGGAGALSETFEGFVIDLKTQLKYYKREVGELRHKIGIIRASKVSSTAVYLFSIGSNDYMSPFLLNSTLLDSYPHSQYVDSVLGNLSTVITAIHKRGGRKFVFLNLGELGCLPGLRILESEADDDRCLQEASDLAQLHNRKLNILLQKMEQRLHGFEYYLYDFKNSLEKRITQPLKYGFEEAKKACCGMGRFNGVFSCGGKRPVKEFEVCENPSNYVFWDSYHFTERLNKQMADEMWNGGVKKLFLCF